MSTMLVPHRRIRLLLLCALLAATPAAHGAPFVNFESGHVRPLALAPGGQRLFAVNTPDNRLAIFDVTPTGLTLAAEVPVGLEPVAVAARTNLAGRVEAWVVNHLSDSVSIVEIDPTDVSASRVTGTLLVGDEPRDLVFGGSARNRAFVTSARRGQNLPAAVAPLLTSEGTPRALVWVFNADAPFADTPFDADAAPSLLGGEPLTIVQLFSDTPRALAVSPDGTRVYAAAFHSGNRTTIVPERAVTQISQGGLRQAPGPPPGSPYPGPCDPTGAAPGPTPPFPCSGLIVQHDPASGEWRDELGQDWGTVAGAPVVMLSLPDRDVFTLNADANPPVEIGNASGVGTVLFNLAVRPDNGKLYASNLAARNDVRFEPLIDATHGVQGHIAESRITVVNGTTATPVHLNQHIDYSVPTGPPDEVADSVAFPLGMAFSGNGRTLYVAGFGSGVVSMLDTDTLEAGTIRQFTTPVGGGPTGLVLDEATNRLYVMNRFEQRVAVVTNASNPLVWGVTESVSLRFDPSPPTVRHGRRLLYDTRISGHGDSACASCHVFGDLDGLAWDLGNPFGTMLANPNPFALGSSGRLFHPMKGPMTTQSLRGMADAGPMHWRGDRTGGNDPGGDPLSAAQAFTKFNPAFVGLLGAPAELSAADMQSFTDFILSVQYPPNPIRGLDNAGTADEIAGETLFRTFPSLGGATPCNDCHALPLGTAGLSFPDAEPSDFKIAHLRNIYQKVGMFGVGPLMPFGVPSTPFLGDQVRGFGLLHDGAIASLTDFVAATVFSLNAAEEAQVHAFVMALSTRLASVVGQQVSATPQSVTDPATLARRDLLLARADAGDCDVVVKFVLAGEARGAFYAGGFVVTDRAQIFPVAQAWADAGTPGQEAVWTCVPPGAGVRMGIDRDSDGAQDRLELDAGTDPADALSFPGGPPIVTVMAKAFKLKDGTLLSDASKRKLEFRTVTVLEPAPNRVVPPAAGSAGDPTLHGATLRVYNAAGSGEQVTTVLPAARWSALADGGFVFKDTTDGAPVSTVKVTPDRLKLKAGKLGWTYTVNEPAQGRMAMRLTLGTGVQWCAEGPAKKSGTPASSAKFDRVDMFRAQPKSPPPVTCPPAPAG